jgi:hypothetical protein
MKILYDNFEVHRVGEFLIEGEGTYCEQIEEDDEAPDAVNIFYTVYGHVPNDENQNVPKGGIEAISDFQNKELAQEMCDFLNGLLDKANIGVEFR